MVVNRTRALYQTVDILQHSIQYVQCQHKSHKTEDALIKNLLLLCAAHKQTFILKPGPIPLLEHTLAV